MRPLRRALDAATPSGALSTAAELLHVGLVEALELLLLVARDDNPETFPARRRHLRRTLQPRNAGRRLAEAQRGRAPRLAEPG